MKDFLYIKVMILCLLVSGCSSSSDDSPDDPSVGELPMIITMPAQNVTAFSALLGGNITSDGGSQIVAVGVYISTSPNPIADGYMLTDTGQPGQFTFEAWDLLAEQTYYFQAFFQSENSWHYGNVLTFTTNNPLQSLNPTDILTTSAVLKATITQHESIGTYAGFFYSTNPVPTVNDMNIGEYVSGTAQLELPISDLLPNTTYYVRPYAQQLLGSSEYVLGEIRQFRTTGYFGPGGGYVAYDKGEIIDGWRYLEVHPTPVNYGGSTLCSWGGSNFISGTTDAFGDGPSNTNIIVANVSDANCAARLCDDLVRGGQSDWFLASSAEMDVIANSLKNGGIAFGNFAWTSTQFNNSHAKTIEESWNGYQVTNNPKDGSIGAYPVRRY